MGVVRGLDSGSLDSVQTTCKGYEVQRTRADSIEFGLRLPARFSRVRNLGLPLAALLVLSSCQVGDELSADSTCLDFITASFEDQVDVVRTAGLEAGWQGAVQGRSESRVAQSCSSPDLDPGEVTLDRIFRVLSQMDGDPDPEVAAAQEEGILGTPTIEGSPLPPAEVFGGDVEALGLQAPMIVGADFAGNPTSIGDLGAPQLVIAISHWSPASDAMLAELATELRELVEDPSVVVTALVTQSDSSRPNWPQDEWFARSGFPGEVLVDDEDSVAHAALGVSALPTLVLIDETGVVTERMSGGIPSASQLEDLVRSLE